MHRYSWWLDENIFYQNWWTRREWSSWTGCTECWCWSETVYHLRRLGNTHPIPLALQITWGNYVIRQQRLSHKMLNMENNNKTLIFEATTLCSQSLVCLDDFFSAQSIAAHHQTTPIRWVCWIWKTRSDSIRVPKLFYSRHRMHQLRCAANSSVANTADVSGKRQGIALTVCQCNWMIFQTVIQYIKSAVNKSFRILETCSDRSHFAG